MEGVEDIPGTAFTSGPWGAGNPTRNISIIGIAERPINISSMITMARSALRHGGMERANAAPTLDEIQQMADMSRVRCAPAPSASRPPRQRPSLDRRAVGARHLRAGGRTGAIAGAMSGRQRRSPAIFAGALNWAPEEPPITQEAELLCRMSALSGRPATFSLVQKLDDADEWRDVLAVTKAGNAQGARVFPQVGSRPTGFVFSLDTYHPFMAKPTYLALKHLPLAARAAEMRKPEIKARILSESDIVRNSPAKWNRIRAAGQRTHLSAHGRIGLRARADGSFGAAGTGWTRHPLRRSRRRKGEQFAISFFAISLNTTRDTAKN